VAFQIPRVDLDALLFSALRAIYQLERTKVVRFGLTYEEIYLLQYLRRRSPSRMGDLATEMKKPVSTATRLMDRLEKKGLVDRRKDKEDRRNVLVSLSANGKKRVQAVEDHTFETISANLNRFPREKVAAFVETARHLGEILAVGDEKAISNTEKEMR
jgi:DNA-binding MarR family transcriptional regulator